MKPKYRTAMMFAFILTAILSGPAFGFYSPQEGRWLSRDPIGEWGGLNVYVSVRNSPIVFIDPNGFAPEITQQAVDDLVKTDIQTPMLLTQRSKKDNGAGLEYCGLICKHKETGDLLWTSTPGTAVSKLPWNKLGECDPNQAPCPECYKRIDAWHTHPSTGSFSPDDKKWAKQQECPFYVCRAPRPGETGYPLEQYDPSTGNTRTVK